MNKIFGFFKDKLNEAKQENIQELQTLTNAINQNQYSREKVLNLLQQAKANYMSWSILIANQASTGLSYAQTHNRSLCLKKIKSNKEAIKNIERKKIKLEQIEKTQKELSQISQLNGNWAQSMTSSVDSLMSSFSKIYATKKNQAKGKQKIELKIKYEDKSVDEKGQKSRNAQILSE